MDGLPRIRHAYRSLYSWATVRLYHELAWAYNLVAWVVSMGRWDAWRRQTLDHVIGWRVLEIGFGTGVLLETAVAQGMPMIGVDPSSEMHRITARRLRRRHLSVPRVRAPAQRLPFADGCFDTIISTFPAGYILDLKTYREVMRVLSPCVQDDRPGRMVVAGVGFRSDRPWLRRLLRAVFAGSGEDSVNWFADRMAELGFRVSVVDDDSRWVRVPVLILEVPVNATELLDDDK